MQLAAFLILSILALASAVVVVTHRDSVPSALALAFNLIAIAGFFFLLDAQFIAFLQVIVYAGAIMVLILFVLMLLCVRDEAYLGTAGRFQLVLALFGAAVLLALVGWGVAASAPGDRFPPAPVGFGTVRVLGAELFERFFYPFEAISLLLVVAMVGAVLLAKRRL
jgi:NADH-quinone oxidoreductase subunit J